MAEIRAEARRNGFGDLTGKVNSLLASYESNAKHIQANARAQDWMYVGEAVYAHKNTALGQLISLDDKLHWSRGNSKLTDQGRVVFDNLTVGEKGKEMSLDDYKNMKVDAAEAHFKGRGRLFEHKVLLYCRSPVAQQLLFAFARRDISQSQLQGGLHVLDNEINTASRVIPEDGDGFSFVWKIFKEITGIEDLVRIVETAGLLGAKDAYTGLEPAVMEGTSEANLGYPTAVAGNYNYRDAFGASVFLLALRGTALYVLKSYGSSSGQSGQGVAPDKIPGQVNSPAFVGK